jgi:hypothetical protein
MGFSGTRQLILMSSLTRLMIVLCVVSSGLLGVAAPGDKVAVKQERFELRPFHVEIEEWPDGLSGYEVLTSSNRFQFVPPSDCITQFDPGRKFVSITSRDGRTSFQIQFTTNLTVAALTSGAMDAMVTNRVAGARNLTRVTRVVDGRRVPSVAAEWGDVASVQKTEYVWCVDARYAVEFRVDLFAEDSFPLRNVISGFFGSFIRTDLPPNSKDRVP